MKPRSVRSIHGVLGGCLHRAVRDGLLTSNPATGLAKELNLRQDSGSAVRNKAMTREQVALLLETIGRPGRSRRGYVVRSRYYNLLLFLARTGCRLSEGLGRMAGCGPDSTAGYDPTRHQSRTRIAAEDRGVHPDHRSLAGHHGSTDQAQDQSGASPGSTALTNREVLYRSRRWTPE